MISPGPDHRAFYDVFAGDNIVMACSLCLQPISHSKGTRYLGTTCIKKYMILHHKVQWEQHLIEQVDNNPPLHSSSFAFAHPNTILNATSLMTGREVSQGISEPYKVGRRVMGQHVWTSAEFSDIHQAISSSILPKIGVIPVWQSCWLCSFSHSRSWEPGFFSLQ